MPRSVLKGQVPSIRLDCVNDRAVNPDGSFVFYWMTAFRRMSENFALDRAIEVASELQKPLLIVETLGAGHRWASDRHHAFVLQGMADNKAACDGCEVRYYPFVEKKPGDMIEFLEALAERACAVVTDEFPIDDSYDEVARFSSRIGVRLEWVDSNGLLPMRATNRLFSTAHAFRRFLQQRLPEQMLDAASRNPLSRLKLPGLRGLPSRITDRWPSASSKLLAADLSALARLPIDHGVVAVGPVGGTSVATSVLRNFLKRKLADYSKDRNHPDADGTSRLSPYLHFGHISTQQIFRELAVAEGWSPPNLGEKATGKREGWWGMSEAAEAFLDELVTWREVGFNGCFNSKDYDRYESLPEWAQETLADHRSDMREYVYSFEEFQQGLTHDRIWNAAQMQLVREGRIHNYLRMLWGKKIIEWTASPSEALDMMLQLNNKYALDGHDPNSYSGIFWVLGRYDRPWGPQRPIFGKIRYMSSENTARKLRLKQYVETYAPAIE